MFRCSPTPPSGSPENGDELVNKRWHVGINLWSQIKKGSIIILALVEHHAPTTTCDGTSWMNMGKLLFWDFTCPLQRKQVSSLNRTSDMSSSPRIPRRYQITKLPLVSRRVSYISWTAFFSQVAANAAVLLQFVLITQTCQFYEHVETTIFLEISPSYHQFRLVSACLLRILCLSKMEAAARNLFT